MTNPIWSILFHKFGVVIGKTVVFCMLFGVLLWFGVFNIQAPRSYWVIWALGFGVGTWIVQIVTNTRHWFNERKYLK